MYKFCVVTQITLYYKLYCIQYNHIFAIMRRWTWLDDDVDTIMSPIPTKFVYIILIRASEMIVQIGNK